MSPTPSKKFFKSQDIVNKAVQTLESIEGGKTPYTGYANAASTVKQALLGDKTRKDRLTTEQLKRVLEWHCSTWDTVQFPKS